MTEHRSSTWSMIDRHCLHALELYERHETAVMPPAVHVGGAAHALLQATTEEANKLGRMLTEEEIAALSDQVSARLVARGRSFEGEPEDPMPPLLVTEGLELAERWLIEHPIYPGGTAEEGLAVDREWKPVEYGRGAWWRGILDDQRPVEIDLMDGYQITDYKTYWSAGEKELLGYQLRGQAVLAWIHGRIAGADIVRVRVANLRTGGGAHVDLDMHGGSGLLTLERWRRQIHRRAEEIEAERLAHGGFRASPGPGCMGCPYLGSCGAVGRFLEATDVPADASERARLCTVLVAKVAQLKDLLEADADGSAVPIAGSEKRLGWRPTESIELAPGGEFTLADLWRKHSNGADNLEGLLMAAKLGAGNLQALARQMAPGDTEAQVALIAPAVAPKTGRSWGVS